MGFIKVPWLQEMTSGSRSLSNGIGYPGYKTLIDETVWAGEDSIFVVEDPWDSQRRTRQWWAKTPSFVSSATNVFGLITERQRLTDFTVDRTATGEAVRLERVPPWGVKPRRTGLPDNPYTKTVTYAAEERYGYRNWGWPVPGSPSCSPGDLLPFYETENSGVIASYAAMSNVWTAPALLDSNDEIKLIGRLREKANGSDFNPSVFLAEVNQSLRMITNSATRIALALKRLKRADVKGAATALLNVPRSDSRIQSPSFRRLDARVQREAQAEMLREEIALGLWSQEDLRKMRTAGRLRAIQTRYKKWIADPERDLSVSIPKTFSQWWLEISYGWMPLLSDAEDSAKLLAHHLNDPPPTRTRATLKKGSSYRRVTRWQWCPDATDYSAEWWEGEGVPGVKYAIGTAKAVHKAQLIAKWREGGDSLPKLLGLTTLESAIHELTPWSFVVDWFIPIGDWLAARGYAQGLQGSFVRSDKRTLVSDTPLGDFTMTSGGTGRIPHKKVVNFDRLILSTLEVPKPTFKPLSKSLSWRHCVNAVALLISGNSQGNPR